MDYATRMNYIHATEFIAYAIFFSFVLVIMITMVLVFCYDKQPGLKTVLVSIAIGCLISVSLTYQNKLEDDAWNGGYCTKCGKPYRLLKVDRFGGTEGEYFYTCDNCGHTIELGERKRVVKEAGKERRKV